MSWVDPVARLLGFERAPKQAPPSAPDPFAAVKAAPVPYVWPTWRAGQPDWTPATLQGYAEAGYEGNSVVFACIRRRAQSAAFAPLVAYTGERANPERLPDDHALARLLRRPNPYQSWYEFMEQGITYLDLDGNLFIFKAGPSTPRPAAAGRSAQDAEKARKVPEALYLLRSDRVRVVPGRTRAQPLLGYVYDADDSGQWLSREPFLPEEVIHVKYPNPRDAFEGFGRGTSPLGAAAKPVDVDNAATSFLKTFFDQGVVPYGLLKSKQSLTDGEVLRIRERLHAQFGGAQNWAETLVLDADADYQPMGMSFREMTFDALDARNEARICQALDVPPILVGAKVGLERATYSNYEQARTAFWQDALIPGVYQRLEDAFDAALGSDDIWVAYDYSNVPALREDESQKAEDAVRIFLGGVAKRNEARGKVGLPPVEQDGFRAADKQQIGAPAVAQTPPEVLDEEDDTDLAGDGDGLDDGDDDVDAGDEGEAGSSKQSPFGLKASTRDYADGALKARLRIERKWAPKIALALRKQLRAALPRGTTAQNVWEAVGRLDGGKQAVADTIYQMMREAALLGIDAGDAQVRATTHGKAVGDMPGATGSVAMEIDWTLVNAEVLEWLKTYNSTLLTALERNSEAAVRAAITRWVSNGLPLRDLIAELRPMFGLRRAEVIAITEVTRAFAAANLATWWASGVVAGWSVRTAMDERVCGICGPLGGVVFSEDGPVDTSIEDQNRNAQIVPLGEGFSHPGGKGSAGKYEGRTFDGPPFHGRCRCWVVPEFEVPARVDGKSVRAVLEDRAGRRIGWERTFQGPDAWEASGDKLRERRTPTP